MHYYMQNMLQVKLEGHMQGVVQLVGTLATRDKNELTIKTLFIIDKVIETATLANF